MLALQIFASWLEESGKGREGTSAIWREREREQLVSWQCALDQRKSNKSIEIFEKWRNFFKSKSPLALGSDVSKADPLTVAGDASDASKIGRRCAERSGCVGLISSTSDVSWNNCASVSPDFKRRAEAFRPMWTSTISLCWFRPWLPLRSPKLRLLSTMFRLRLRFVEPSKGLSVSRRSLVIQRSTFPGSCRSRLRVPGDVTEVNWNGYTYNVIIYAFSAATSVGFVTLYSCCSIIFLAGAEQSVDDAAAEPGIFPMDDDAAGPASTKE